MKGSKKSLNPDEARHVNHWALVMRLLNTRIPYGVIMEMNDAEVSVILSILFARDKQREEDNK